MQEKKGREGKLEKNCKSEEKIRPDHPRDRRRRQSHLRNPDRFTGKARHPTEGESFLDRRCRALRTKPQEIGRGAQGTKRKRLARL